MAQNALITGASIAGPALAWWLHRAGLHVTVVERAPEFRDGGQNIDVRGAGRTVLERMGLFQAVKDLGTGEQGLAFVDENDAVVAEFDEADLGSNGPTVELEILRGDLAQLLYEHTRHHADYRFGDHITALEETEEGVTVTFAHGGPQRFDLVVVAEGANSTTRELLFGPEVIRKPYDLYVAYFTIPRAAHDHKIARWYNAPGGRGVCLRPDNKGTTRALLSLQQEPAGYEHLPPTEQKQLLQQLFADAGWETPRVLEGLTHAPDFYFESVSQVKLGHWTKGRVVLTGDAAWCAGPFGVGTTEALVGSYVLAGELQRHTKDYRAAFAAYEHLMRPYVEEGQDVPKVGPRLSSPQSRLGIALQRAALRIAAAPGIRQVVSKLAAPPTDAIELPDYKQAD
ncbi:FAD-dependent monooxygenase [Hymenobacter sp. BT186]|uniref:FAD-dependent monooxygenase n=1 Tax=Hymenobacter telluris TaxID=2816474 RepID=A0A939EZ48_9BACT|nr:FAD-dependent monooxygenase [Hymenobacter telluris]MBO0359210.1 FAD-dependent monooxygenase [Hymenobacter telluris]MBW3375236.1 FAD-dependent monooxygenase [Hymenobacter norwichensis]